MNENIYIAPAFIKLQREDNEYKISYRMNRDKDLKNMLDKFEKYSIQMMDYRSNRMTPEMSDLTKTFNDTRINEQNFFFSCFGVNINEAYSLYSDDYKADYYLEKLSDNGNISTFETKVKDITNKEKYNVIFFNMISMNMYVKLKNMTYCDREINLINYRINAFRSLFQCLNKGGSVYLKIMSFCHYTSIEYFYILNLMFEYIVISKNLFIYCHNFLDNDSIIKDPELKKLINKNFTFEPKYNINKVITFFNEALTESNYRLNILENNDFESYKNFTIKSKIVYINELINRQIINKDILISYLKSIINDLKYVYIDGRIVRISSAIKNTEGMHITNMIERYQCKNILEVGMAFGISAFYILSNEKTNLISLDPFQETQWYSSGIKLLKEYGMIDRHKLIKKRSYEALPQLLEKYGANSFDMIFIDGWHTFDYTLVDFFYANLLLKINGIIIIDDALHNGVKKCVDYLTTNYVFYKKLASPITVATFKKTRDDDRSWNFHKNF